MLVSVVSVHTELPTPALCSAHVADVACCVSQGSRPFATTTVVPERAAVTSIFALLATVMFAVELSADVAARLCVAAALMDALDARLALASFATIGDAARLPVALKDAAPTVNVSPEAASAELALIAESAAWVRLGAAERLPDALKDASPNLNVSPEALTAELAVRLDAAPWARLDATLTVELAVRLDVTAWVRLGAALTVELAVRLDRPRRASVEA